MNHNITQTRLAEEYANFQKAMEELRLLRKVSGDIRRYKKMISIRKFD